MASLPYFLVFFNAMRFLSSDTWGALHDVDSRVRQSLHGFPSSAESSVC